jgi:non-specific serine/threonine protein kinase
VLRESLTHFYSLGDTYDVALVTDEIAHLALATGNAARAAHLFALAAKLLDSIGSSRPPSERLAVEQAHDVIRVKVGKERFERATEVGSVATLAEVVELALASTETPVAMPAARDPLSPREREVAALLALGRTNKQIAEELLIADRTAERHVKNILAKLGLDTRTQIGVWATQRGLVRLAIPSDLSK